MANHRLIGGTIAALVCAVQLATGARADSNNPVDAVQIKLADRASRLGNAPQGIIPLLELWRNWDRATPGKTLVLLERLAQDRRLSAPRRVYVRSLLADAKIRLGNLEEISRGFDELGFVRQWRVLGPFSNEGKRGLDRDTPPESRSADAPDMQAFYPGRERLVKWRVYPDIVRGGYISLDAVYRPNENVCALAETSVQVDKRRALTLWLGAGGAVKAYWNGRQVYRDAAYRQPTRDRAVAMVQAREGLNRLLVKVCTADSRWGFYLRIGDQSGDAAKGLRYDAAALESVAREEKDSQPRLPAPPVAPLDALEQAKAKNKSDAAALEGLARYLSYTDSDDPSERRAKQLAAEAARVAPTAARLCLAARLAEERGEVMRFADQARALAPRDPEVLLLSALVIAGGPAPEDALELLDSIPVDSEYYLESRDLRATILRGLELPQSAYAELQNARAAAGTPAALRALAETAAVAGHQDQAVELRRRLLAVRYDDIDARRSVIDDALERGQVSEVLEQVEILRQLAPGNASLLRYMGSVYDALKRDDLALATYRKATELAPEDAVSLAAYGRALLRAEYREGALEAFRKALAFRPQDAETRELVEQLQKVKLQQRLDEAYAMPPERFLQKRRSVAEYPATILQELAVNTVFENGLGSSFRQLVAQVHNDEGTRQWRSYSIQYDPDSQRVDLRLARVYRSDGRILESVETYEEQLGEPWYRIYYDTRAVVVVFPDLEPGDTVELRYRIDDIAHRNLFADYYGDLHQLQRFIPIVRSEYVLITPVSRKFYFHPPGLTGLQHLEAEKGERRVDRFVVKDIPAIREEPGMPGLTEISPYLHVSTYSSWIDVGKWYWGLIKDQLYADDSLKRKIKEITDGVGDTRIKVQRIHNWVVRNTRYVALEFGIHGFLPYRAPLVVQRGFGDCKDKASLLYTMLRESGIEARVALVRTRHNGAIDESPASLAVFDHAIVYVPDLDLYLDPTAEHSGTVELPVEDQGVMVLLVGPGGSELRRTPELEPQRNRRTRTLRVRLAADGSAQLEGAEDVAGVEAARYRDIYQASGTRRERFERSLASDYPGVELLSETFESLEELESPVRFTYRARAPQIGRWDGGELRLPPSVLQNLIDTLARSPERRYPLDLQGTSSYLEQRTVQIPPGMHLVNPPAGGEADSEFGTLSLRFRTVDKQLVAITEFDLKKDRITPKQYPAFRRWVEEADLLLRQRIGVRKGEP